MNVSEKSLIDEEYEECFECGEKAYHDHHVIPKFMGGQKTIPLCEECHGKVHDMDLTGTERMKIEARKKRIREGLKAGGRAPVGYIWNYETKEIIIDEEKRYLVPVIFNKYLALGSLEKVRKYLAEEYNFSLSTAGVFKVLKNRFYIGEVKYGDVIEKEGRHEPLISKVQFGKVQAMLKRNKRGGRRKGGM